MKPRTSLGHGIRAGTLGGPVALAFASGGFYDEARLTALLVAAGLLGLWALIGPAPVPRDRRALLAIGGLSAYCGWVALSTGWAPQADVAHGDLQRVLLYLGALILGATLWRARSAARAVEPAVAAGIATVMVYGLAGRLLPGVVHLATGRLSGSRLYQPLTYWNAEGELAAIGFILCARIAGDRTRPGAARVLAAAAAVPVGTALYLTFSRGALITLAGGLLILLALAPTWSQLRAIALTVEAAALSVAVCASLRGVNDLAGGLPSREGDGVIAVAAMLAIMLVTGAGAAWSRRVEEEQRARVGPLPLPARSGWIAGLLAVSLIAIPIAAAGGDHGPARTPRFGETTARLSSTGSNRYEYWKVALAVFADEPVRGVGSGGFGVEWLQRRHIDEIVHDAHSLYLETLAELGLVGLLALGLALTGVVACARAVQRDDPALAAGPIAALAAFGLHAGIDWDWEMPALTLPVISLAAVLLSRAGVRNGD